MNPLNETQRNYIEVNMAKNDDEFDFGFTAVSEDDIIDPTLTTQTEDLKLRLQSVEKMILPLLQNLMKNPEKEMIKWPNRKEIIEKQIEKLLKITRI